MRKENKSKLFKKVTYWIASLTLVAQTLFGAMPVLAVDSPFYEAVTGFTLIDSATDVELGSINHEGYLYLNSLTDVNRLNIKAEVSDASLIGSVKFVLDSGTPGEVVRIENVAPYALFGDSAPDYYDGGIALGEHTLTATPFSSAGASGLIGMSYIINFTVVDDSTAPIVNITSPSTGDALSGGFTVCGTAADISPVSYVQLRFQDPTTWAYINNGFKTYPDANGNWCIDINGASGNNVADGVWGIRAVTMDIWGNKSNKYKFSPLTIDNVLPRGSITNPINGDLIINVTTGYGEVDIAGNAYDELSGLNYTKGKALIRSLAKKPNGAWIYSTAWYPLNFVGDDFSVTIPTLGFPSRDDYEVAVVVYDNAGNSKWLWRRPVIKIDNDVPESSAEGIPEYTNTQKFNISTASSDDTILDLVAATSLVGDPDSTNYASGVDYLELWYRKDNNTCPVEEADSLSVLRVEVDDCVDGFVRYPGEFDPSLPIEFDSSLTGGDGYYEFFTVAVDMAGNRENYPWDMGGTLAAETSALPAIIIEPKLIVADASTIVDTQKPEITLNGDSVIELTVGDEYLELGAVWTDLQDGTGDAIVDNSAVFTDAVGKYLVTYNYTDSAGNQADEVTRIVNVVAAPVLPATTFATTLYTGDGGNQNNEGEVLGDQDTGDDDTSDTDGEIQGAFDEADEDINNFLGLAWYWWLLIVAIFGSLGWWLIAGWLHRDEK